MSEEKQPEDATTVHSVIPAGGVIREVEASAVPSCDPEDIECQRNVLEHLKGLEGALEHERAAADPNLGDLLETVRETITQVETNLESCNGLGEEMPDG